MSYVPDNAKVRDKMVYASTRAILIKELADYRFTKTIYGTQEPEFTIDSSERYLAHKAADKPLTRRQRELAEIKGARQKTRPKKIMITVTDNQGTSVLKSYVVGISFPLTKETIKTLYNLAKLKEERENNYVSLCLDNEKIDLNTESPVPVNKLKDQIPSNAPRFTFYVFEHEYPGETKKGIGRWTDNNMSHFLVLFTMFSCTTMVRVTLYVSFLYLKEISGSNALLL
ncbi:hypothetical protein CLU79DRAFT_877149, partial [Phycomyces nitens]